MEKVVSSAVGAWAKTKSKKKNPGNRAPLWAAGPLKQPGVLNINTISHIPKMYAITSGRGAGNVRSPGLR